MFFPRINKALVMVFLLSVGSFGCAQSQSERLPHAEPEASASPAEPSGAEAGLLDGITMNRLDGGEIALGDRSRGQAVLIVNTASQCGFVDNFEGLQNLHERYSDRGLVVVGVPSGDFRGQEFERAAQIRAFCEDNYGVEFLMLEKSHVTGEGQIELFQRLTDPANDPDNMGDIEWNFEKFILDREGRLIARFRSRDDPESDEVVAAVEEALGQS